MLKSCAIVLLMINRLASSCSAMRQLCPQQAPRSQLDGRAIPFMNGRRRSKCRAMQGTFKHMDLAESTSILHAMKMASGSVQQEGLTVLSIRGAMNMLRTVQLDTVPSRSGQLRHAQTSRHIWQPVSTSAHTHSTKRASQSSARSQHSMERLCPLEFFTTRP